MAKIALISCCKEKMDRRARAEFLYRSRFFRLKLNYAQMLKFDKIFILSACHGLLALEKKVSPYDCSIDDYCEEQKRVWAENVIIQLREVADLEKDEFTILAGKSYKKYLRSKNKKDLHSKIARHKFNDPLEGDGIGDQMKFLKKKLSEGKAERECKWLHKQLEELPIIRSSFELEHLPKKGIYFFYEDDEYHVHDEKRRRPRIVRIGTHMGENFRKRIKQHFLPREESVTLSTKKKRPSDDSIFRKHIGTSLLNKDRDDYLKIWNRDFRKSKERKKYRKHRDIREEEILEDKITQIIRGSLSFRFIVVEDEVERIGEKEVKGLEAKLIATVGQCRLCEPSKNWLGLYNPKETIRRSGLWNVQHVKGNELIERNDRRTVKAAIKKTKDFLKKIK